MPGKDSIRPSIRLIAFLGNPGSQYRNTRHNIGWHLAEHLTRENNLSWKSKFKGLTADWIEGPVKIPMLKPQTFMNQSGQSVQAALHFYHIPPSSLLVIHDEIELDFGVVHFKNGGGHGGHNGLRSIVQSLGDNAFLRFRMGVSRPQHGNVAGFVLSSFTDEETPWLSTVMDRSLQIIREALADGPNQASFPSQKIRLIP